MNSSKWQFSIGDFKNVLHNALVFLAPLALLYIGFVMNNINASGFALADFVPSNLVIGAGALYVLNVLQDFFLKFKKDSTTVINS